MNSLLNVFEITVDDSLLYLLPSKGRLKIRKVAAVNLSRILALKCRMTLLNAVSADLWRLVRAVRSTVTDLLAETAGASELPRDSFIGTLGLGVT